MKRLCIFIILIIATVVAMAQDFKPKFAVYFKGNDPADEIIANKLMKRMAETGRYRLLDRSESFRAALSKELSVQHSGVVYEKQIAKVGKQYGAEQVCVISKESVWNDEKYISAHVVDVDKAEIVLSFSAFGKLNTTSDLKSMVEMLTRNFIEVFDCFKLPDADTVAVYVTKTNNRDVDIILGDQLVSGFAKSGRYVAVERTDEFVAGLQNEIKFRQSGMVDDKQFAKLGKQMGAQQVCIVKVTQFDGHFYIYAHLVDVETAEVIKASSREEVLLSNTPDVVRCGQSLAYELAGKKASDILGLNYDYKLDSMDNDNETEVVDMSSFTEEVVNGDYNSPLVEEREEEVEEEVVIIPDVNPEFPGGEDKLYEYLAENLRYPDIARDGGITGKVLVKFVIEKDGSITNIRVTHDIGGGCGEKVKRLVRHMPRWRPGKVGGRTVRSQFILPVDFILR